MQVGPPVTVEIVWQPQGQQLEIGEGPQIVIEDGKVRLEHLVLRGTLNGKSSGSVKLGVTLGDRLAAALGHAIISLGRPQLGRASDAHKLLPLLLQWTAELLDAPARAA